MVEERETILLVEDEESLRRVARRALERGGYAVISAADGLEALQVSARHAGAIDLLVSDVIMPELRGPDLAIRLREERPGLRVLFISGYVRDAFDQMELSEEHFLMKPFSATDLLNKVRSILDAL